MSEPKYKVILLDRDGVINHEPGPILTADKFIFVEGSIEAIRQLNQLSCLVIVISNQGAIAKGTLTWENLERINDKMKQGLTSAGAHLDGLFYCPHFPQYKTGYLAQYAVPCECRKPGVALVQRAMLEHGFTLDNAILVGDSTSDWEMAARLRIPSIGVKTGHAGLDGKFPDRQPTFWAADLLSAVHQFML